MLAVCTAVMSSLPLRMWTEYTAYRVCMYKVCRHVYVIKGQVYMTTLNEFVSYIFMIQQKPHYHTS